MLDPRPRWRILRKLALSAACAACTLGEQDTRNASVAQQERGSTIDPAAVPGTYELRVCRLACPSDSAGARPIGAVLRRGRLVLTAGSNSFEGRSDSIGIMLGGFIRSPVNGCYVLDIVRADVPSYAFTLGGTHWELDPAGREVKFSLYNSPDAGYAVRATLNDGVLRGVGESWGVGAAEVDYPPDVIEGHRVSEADVSPCLAAVGPAMKAMRSPTRGRAHNANGEW